MRKAYYIKRTKAGTAFDIFNGIFLAVLMFVMVYPFWNVLVLSFNDGIDAVLGGIYFWPRKFSLSSYEYVLRNKDLAYGALISVLRVVVGTSTGVFGCALLGYIVTCRQFYGRKFMRLLFIVTMYFGGGLIPTYLLMMRLGLVGSFNVYWIPGIFNCYYMLLAASYIQNLPDALFESARIDGASEMKTFFAIVLPLTVPMLACLAVYIGVTHWNNWFDVMLYSQGKWDTLQIMLYRLLNAQEALKNITNQQQLYSSFRTIQPETVRAATTVIVTVPIVCIYPFLQRYFINGITMGAVKG